MRVSPGGTATINGIWYQMLWCLLETATLRVLEPPGRKPGTEDVNRVTLVLEPSDGGDACLLRPDLQQIVQLKARSGGGTWSLRDLVNEVLPDLYRAVKFNREQEFVFFTEGKRGEWGVAEDFFTKLATIRPPLEGQPASPLLDTAQIVRYRGLLQDRGGNSFTELSERELFGQIVSSLRVAHPHVRADSETESERKVWHLLSRLKFRWGETKDDLEYQLLNHLRSLVDNPDRVHDTLHTLLAKLMERAVRGNEPIDATTFFAENGLSGVPLVRRQWPRLVKLGAEQTRRDLSRRFRYTPSGDVRPGSAELLSMPPVDLWKRGSVECLALTGESGQGKTWRLYALALALAESDAPVAVVIHDGDAEKVARDAAHRFWSTLCHRTTQLRLEEIARHLIEIGAVAPGATWLYVLVDGVKAPQQALALYREIGAVEGVKLAFTAPDRVANRFSELPDAPGILVQQITDFTEEETRRYIVDGDAVRWHDIRDEQYNGPII